MKIGIVTVEKSANVGSFLQAYALQKVLEAWGHEVYFVSAGQESFFKREYCWFIPKRGNLKYPVKFIKRNLDGLKKYKLFAQDHKKLKTWDKKEKLDLFILGSDEIWNVQRKIFQNPIYYGKDLSPVISYAVSVGDSEGKDFLPFHEVTECIRKIEFLSVRDEKSCEAVKRITGKYPEKVCDPTFLLDTEAYTEPYEDIYLKENRYILVYFYNGSISVEIKKKIREYAHAKGLKVVSAALYNDWCDYHVTCRPTQYNDIVRRAEYVITGTFHGNVFAIQNRKRFITIPLSEKVRDLICNFGLQDIILELDDLSGETMEAILEHQNMDYEKIGKKIQKMRQSSLEFLKNALENYDSSDM